MWQRKKWLITWTIVFILAALWNNEIVLAASLDEYDLDSLNGYVEEEYFDIDFSALVKELYSTDFSSTDGILGQVMEFFLLEIRGCIKLVLAAMGLIIGGAVFKSLTGVLNDSTVMKAGIFITYIAVMTVLFVTFEEGFRIAGDSARKAMDFLYALIPTFFCAVTFAQGSLTGSVMYQWTGVCISMVQIVVINFLLPLINYYVVMCIINNATEDKRFNSMCALMKKIIQYVNRTLLGIIVGMTSIKSLTVPLTDSLKNTFLRKTVAIIPGIGNGVESVAETIAGTGNLIKNTIGTAGVIVVFLIVAVPFVKLLAMNLILRFLGAVTEPVAAKNVVGGINAISDGIGILQYILSTSCLVLVITIGIICIMTGV